MSKSAFPQRSLQQLEEWVSHAADVLHKYPNDHPVQISFRTYALAIFFSLSPPIMTFATSTKVRAKGVSALLRVFRRELGMTGFAFAMTVAVGGGAALRKVLKGLTEHKNPQNETRPTTRVFDSLIAWLSELKGSHKTLLSYMLSAGLAVALLQYPQTHSRKTNGLSIPTNSRPSITLGLTMLLLVRALDSIVRAKLLPSGQADGETITNEDKEKALARRQSWTLNIDAFLFWASSAR